MREQEVLRYCLQESDRRIAVRITTDEQSTDSAWTRFKGRLRYRAEMTGATVNPYTYCKYAASDKYQLGLYRPADIPNELLPATGKELWPVIYETNEYWVSVRFEGIDKDSAHVQHVRADVEDAFKTVWDSNGITCTISGRLSFLNEPGLFRLGIVYTKNGIRHEDFIAFHVVSPKLDVKNDYQSILQTVNRELEKDVFRYLSLTVQQMSPSRDRSKDLQIWMQVFENLAADYIKNIIRIIKNPHSKVRTIEEYKKADRIHRWTLAMEETYHEKQKEGVLDKYYFRNEVYDTTVNSMENRFVKYTLQNVGKRLNEVFSKVLTKNNTEASDSLRDKWTKHQAAITRLLRHPFFSHVGRFEGMQHESLVLQSRMGYQQVYKDWLKLKKGIDIFEGTTNVGVMQIWEIYELWCFIKVKNMICRILSNNGQYELDTDEPNGPLIHYSKERKIDYTLHINYPEEWGMSGRYVSLHYQHIYNRHSGTQRTFTTDNRPDIVLNIHQPGQEELTYLFDAKYRVWSDPQLDKEVEEQDAADWEKELEGKERLLGADYPPSDAINQMHRYRDAIYYGMDEKERPRNKEIIGGYILFPGRAKGDVTRYFSASIQKINIGAFPLLPFGLASEEKSSQTPDFEPEGQELYNHLKSILIEKKSVYAHVRDAIPQRGLHYEKGDANEDIVYVGTVKSNNKWITDFKNHCANIYYTGGTEDLSGLDIQSVRYFMPLVNGCIDGIYKVSAINVARKSQMQAQNDNPDDGVRLFMMLDEYIPFGEPVNVFKRITNGKFCSMREAIDKYQYFKNNPI